MGKLSLGEFIQKRILYISGVIQELDHYMKVYFLFGKNYNSIELVGLIQEIFIFEKFIGSGNKKRKTTFKLFSHAKKLQTNA